MPDAVKDAMIAALMSVGYPAEQRIHPGRRGLDRNIFRERYRSA
ncbi:hypothetical protein [Nocardia crassostreae]|nr:hypothetical protein [Nocardia crassostreae]